MDFITWESLVTYAGVIAFVAIFSQFTKDLAWAKKIPTQLFSAAVALVTLLVAHYFVGDLSLNVAAQSVFNAIIVSLAANGTFSAVQRITGNDVDGVIISTGGSELVVSVKDEAAIEKIGEKGKATFKVEK